MSIEFDIKNDKNWKKFIKLNGTHLLHEYIKLNDRKEKADLMVSTHGELVASPNGFPVVSPWLSVGNKARAEMMVIFKMVHGTASAPANVDGKKSEAEARAEVATSGKFAPSAPPTLKAVKK